MKTTLVMLCCLVCAAGSSFAQGFAKFFISPTLIQFQSVNIGDSLDKTISFIVDSSAPNDVNVSMSNPKLASYSYVGPSSFTVKKGSTYSLTVRFKPVALGAQRDTVFATHNGDTSIFKSPARITFGGQGLPKDTFPRIQVTSQIQGLNFGIDSMGTVTTKTFYVINASDTQRVLNGTVGNPKTTNFSFIGAAGNFSLNKGDSMKVTVAFSAPNKAGSYRDTLTITSNANASNSTIKLSMFATVPGPDTVARISILPSNRFLVLGPVSVGKSKQQTVTIKNTTNVDLQLSGNVSSTNHSKSYSIVSGAGPYSIKKGDSAHVVINFAPDTIGNRIDTLIVTSNSDPSNQKFNILMVGQGTAPDTLPRLALSGVQQGNGAIRLNFGTSGIGVPTSHTFTISNTTDSKIATLIGTVGTPAKPQFAVTAGGGAFTLDSGKAQSVTMTFTPTALAQVSDTLILTSNDSTAKLVRIVLTGSGRLDTMAKITLSTTTIDFGTVAVGAPAVMRGFTLTNSSDTARSLNGSVSYPIAPFRLESGGGTYSLLKGASANDTVVMTPVVPGTYDDSIVVTSNTDASTSRLVIHLHGVVLADAVPDSRIVEHVSLFPNPARSSTTLALTLAENTQMQATIYDLRGNAVKHVETTQIGAGAHNLPLELEGLHTGSYLLKLQLDDGTRVIRLVVSK